MSGRGIIEAEEEEAKLLELVEDFGAAMFLKLVQKKRDGYEGWDENTAKNVMTLKEGLDNHLDGMDKFDRSNLVDIANFCAFLWNLEKKS